MRATYPSLQVALRPPGSIIHWLVGLALAFLLALAGNAAFATPPAAGTSIGNQASASYLDGSGASRTVTSNTVTTVVQQVASLTLTASGTKTASVGSTVYYPHTLTNTGNGTDTFGLTAVNAGGATFNMPVITIYADNGSGQPTGAAITSSGPLAAGAAFKFIVAATVPATATSGQTNSLTVAGASGFAVLSVSNTDITTVTANAVISLTKSISASSGAAGSGPYTYTLTYTNTGNNTATGVKITDAIPAGMTEAANSGLWSVTGVTALTDASHVYGSAPNQITYDYGVTTAGTVTALISNVAPGQSGTISFKVNVNAGSPGTINNTALVAYNDGVSAATGQSNVVPFIVTQSAAVAITGATVASASPGSAVSFSNVIKNNGNGTDTFNISLAGTTFPSGTSFVLYKSDGVTPLVDTNGDGIPDTGPLAAGASYTVVVKAMLPASISVTGPFVVNKTATSTIDPTKSATAADTLTAVTKASVDVTNVAPIGGSGVKGTGPGAELTAQVTNSTNPATTTTFVVVTNNTGPIADTYNLDTSTALPAGWTVSFKADGGSGNCSTTGATITNTGTVNSGGTTPYATVCAVVSVPAGFAAGTADLYFRALSPATGAIDIIHDAVTVNAVRSLTYTPNNTAQVFPGGSVVYSHTLTNTGNVVEGSGAASSTITLPATNSQAGWTSVQYYNVNNSGVIGGSDPVIPAAGLQAVLAAGLAPGQSITILDKVIAPSGVAAGVINTTSMTATTTNGSTYLTTVPAAALATDSTTVIVGNVTLVKTQGLDAGCTGSPVGYSTANITGGAVPGACIDYQITVQNVGSTSATGVTVSDATPAYTVLSTAPATSAGSITLQPAVAAAGTITATIGLLAPGQSAVVTFGVKIQP
jgi:trimeric autotransporter adhesin